MSRDLVLLIVLGGTATWAFRYLPIRWRWDRTEPEGAFGRFLAATGPAAIATLAAATIWPLLAGPGKDLLPLACGLAAVIALWAWRRSVVLATLGGPLAYGLALGVARWLAGAT